ncbi:right-handed parallel beta-helix repeat-containing protein [Kiritimatiellaeota bacterium B1221]|nr:right-handed parallel beta-helix repeat-containing protein [Kiritimatiellaeota bacterium B1221]
MDPYELEFFLPVPEQGSADHLTDSAFFVQSVPDYWKGATLLLYDGYPNAIVSQPIVGFDPDFHRIQTEPFHAPIIGNNQGRADKFALRNHIGLLDQPGEYYVDTSVTPHVLTVIPYPDQDTAAISASKRPHGFYFEKAVEHIVIDGFEIQSTASHGVCFTGRGNNHITLKNIKSTFNMGSGISVRSLNHIRVENCVLRENHDNGLSFSNITDLEVLDCLITENGDNGIWLGGGQPDYWNSERILIRGCEIVFARARRRHPDNFQMHQVRDITIENCLFVQEGEQNMWCQYSDNFTVRNNIFVGGPLGINSSRHSAIYHNVFWNSSLRYDRHLTNHPQNKDYFLPQEALIQNNLIVNSAFTPPDVEGFDRFKVFQVDHNYFHFSNAHMSGAWDWKGQALSLDESSTLLSKEMLPVDGGAFAVDVGVVWGHPGELLFQYQDEENYFALGLGNNHGVYMMKAGEKVPLHDGKNLRGGAMGRYQIHSRKREGQIEIAITKLYEGESTTENITFADEAGGFNRGWIGVRTPEGKDGRIYLDNVELRMGTALRQNDFEDRNPLQPEGKDSVQWEIVQGGVQVKAIDHCRGVGFGEGSLVSMDPEDLKNLVIQLPDENGEGFDFHPLPQSPLRGAGADVGVREDAEGYPRPAGVAPSIGPFESK